jgi:hypothetical protein
VAYGLERLAHGLNISNVGVGNGAGRRQRDETNEDSSEELHICEGGIAARESVLDTMQSRKRKMSGSSLSLRFTASIYVYNRYVDPCPNMI